MAPLVLIYTEKKIVANQKHYVSYLLRLWRVDATAESQWRASLESPQTGEQIGFGSMERLFAFLSHQTGIETERIATEPARNDQRRNCKETD